MIGQCPFCGCSDNLVQVLGGVDATCCPVVCSWCLRISAQGTDGQLCDPGPAGQKKLLASPLGMVVRGLVFALLRVKVQRSNQEVRS